MLLCPRPFACSSEKDTPNKQIHLGETPPDIISEDDEGDLLKLDSTEKAHLVMVSLFRSHLPSPVGSMEMAGPPDQNVQAGYMMSW